MQINGEKLKAWMDEYVQKEKFNGCSLNIANSKGEVLLDIASGFADTEKTKEFSSRTIVRIFSMTKAIISACLLQLLHEKKIGVDETLDHYFDNYCDCFALVKNAKDLTEIKRTKAPTIFQLLNHTSGLSYFFNDDLIAKEYLKKNLTTTPKNYDLALFSEKITKLPLNFDPGTQWKYSVGIDLAGRLIEIISGLPLDVYITENLLNYLNMDDTKFYLPENKTDRFSDCFFYHKMSKNFFPLVSQYQNFYYKKHEVKNFSGGSGLLSTGRDYIKFANLLLNDGKLEKTRVFAKEVMSRIRSNSIERDIATIGVKSFAQMPTFGMGHSLAGSVMINPNAGFRSNVGDLGWGGMASNYFWVDFKNNYTAVFMTQLLPSASYPNRRELKELVHGSLRF